MQDDSARRSARVAEALTACSLTPRSGRTYLAELEELRRFVPLDEHLYTEANLALVEGRTDVARSLYDQCSEGYRNVEEHKRQCEAYERLLASGVVHRPATREVRAHLASLFEGETEDSVCVSRYAEVLWRQGYTAPALRTLALGEVATVTKAMSVGHAARVLADAWARASACARLGHVATHLAGSARFHECLRAMRQAEKEDE